MLSTATARAGAPAGLRAHVPAGTHPEGPCGTGSSALPAHPAAFREDGAGGRQLQRSPRLMGERWGPPWAAEVSASRSEEITRWRRLERGAGPGVRTVAGVGARGEVGISGSGTRRRFWVQSHLALTGSSVSERHSFLRQLHVRRTCDTRAVGCRRSPHGQTVHSSELQTAPFRILACHGSMVINGVYRLFQS